MIAGIFTAFKALGFLKAASGALSFIPGIGILPGLVSAVMGALLAFLKLLVEGVVAIVSNMATLATVITLGLVVYVVGIKYGYAVTEHRIDSVRAQHTLTPLAQLLGLPISTQFRKGEERALAAAATSSSGTVLIAWEHKAICELANILMGNVQSTPQTWPDERFDIVWVFNADGAGWQFHQVPELVLPGDAVTPIA